MQILPDAAQVPPANRGEPPGELTHRLAAGTPFFWVHPGSGDAPAGILPSETLVWLLSSDGGTCCEVVDGRGVRMIVARALLEPR
jgi:hypothetical protein